MAIQISTRKKEEAVLIRSLIQLGQYFSKLHDYHSAIEKIERAVKILHAKNVRFTSDNQQADQGHVISHVVSRDGIYLEAIASLTHCYRAIDNHEKCGEFASKGARMARGVNNPDIEFHCLGEAGRSFQQLGKWTDALEAFELQSELLSEASLPIAWADCLLGIVDCYEKLDRFADGFETLMELQAKCDSDFVLRIRIFDRLAKFQEENLGDIKGAIRSLESLLYASIKIKQSRKEREAYYNLGRLHGKLERYEQAERCLEKAHQIDIENQSMNPELEIELARVALLLKKYSKVFIY